MRYGKPMFFNIPSHLSNDWWTWSDALDNPLVERIDHRTPITRKLQLNRVLRVRCESFARETMPLTLCLEFLRGNRALLRACQAQLGCGGKDDRFFFHEPAIAHPRWAVNPSSPRESGISVPLLPSLMSGTLLLLDVFLFQAQFLRRVQDKHLHPDVGGDGFLRGF